MNFMINNILLIQEVVADDTPAIEVVLKADTKRMDLLKKKEEMETNMNKKNKEVDMDELQDVYDELRAINADKAEPKARRLVFWLFLEYRLALNSEQLIFICHIPH